MTVPWTLLVSSALGLWLMFAPDVLGTNTTAHTPATDSDHLVGPLIIVVAVCAMAEVIRSARFLNVLLGLWLIAAPWLLSGFTPAARWNDMLVGLAVILLSFPRGPVRERYGNWDPYIV